MLDIHAVILAGGKGSRLPVSARNIPKTLVPVGDKAILARQIEALLAAGIQTITVSLGFRADQIIAFLKERHYPCRWVVEPEPLDTGGAARLASAGRPEPLLVLNGDILADFDFAAIAAAYRPGTALMVATWLEDARDFGLLWVESGLVFALLGKPETRMAGYAHTGCTIIHPDELAGVSESSFSLEWDVLAPMAADEGRVKLHVHRGWWFDIGTEERLAAARAHFELGGKCR